jgi:hypothetical protein
MTENTPVRFTSQQLQTITELGNEDCDIDYNDLMEIVEVAKNLLSQDSLVIQSGGGGG